MLYFRRVLGGAASENLFDQALAGSGSFSRHFVSQEIQPQLQKFAFLQLTSETCIRQPLEYLAQDIAVLPSRGGVNDDIVQLD